MKKILKIFVIVLIAAFALAQFIRPEMQNPPVNESERLEATTEVPENIKTILRVSCSDCHTNKTAFPWYSKITPVSWWLVGHINEGRKELNFSVWKTYKTARQVRKLDEICEMVEEREMPLPSYLWVHWDAKLSGDDIRSLCDWSKQEKLRIQEASNKTENIEM